MTQHFKLNIVRATALGFSLFLLRIIYLADTGQQNILFALAKSLPYGDKIGHVAIFGFFTAIVNFALKFQSANIGRARIYSGTLFIAMFALLEEMSQYFMSTRSFDLLDLIADSTGVIVATLICRFAERRAKQRWIQNSSPPENISHAFYKQKSTRSSPLPRST